MTLSNDLRAQIFRFALAGGGLTVFHAAIYWIGAVPLSIEPLLANLLAFLCAVALGFSVHSRWSFKGHGRRDRPLRARAVFLSVNIVCFLLNSFWVWLFVQRLGTTPSWPLLPIVMVTPWLSFYLNRRWTFSA